MASFFPLEKPWLGELSQIRAVHASAQALLLKLSITSHGIRVSLLFVHLCVIFDHLQSLPLDCLRRNLTFHPQTCQNHRASAGVSLWIIHDYFTDGCHLTVYATNSLCSRIPYNEEEISIFTKNMCQHLTLALNEAAEKCLIPVKSCFKINPT